MPAFGVNIGIDDLLGRKKRQRREVESASIAERLMDDGRFTPSEVNGIVSRYLKSGQFEVPTSRMKTGTGPRMIESDEIEANPDLPERSTMNNERISLRKKKALIGYDDEGRISDLSDLVSDADSVNTVRVGREADGYHNVLDKKTGAVLKRYKNGKKYDTYGSAGETGSGSGPEDPDVALAKDTVRKYQDAKKRGDPLPAEFVESARSAFDLLKIPFTEEEKPATMPEKIRNKVSSVAPSVVSPAPKRYSDPVPDFDRSKEAEYQKDLADARRAVGKNLLTQEEAARRLQKKWGRRAGK
jgi:hypothetical protein